MTSRKPIVPNLPSKKRPETGEAVQGLGSVYSKFDHNPISFGRELKVVLEKGFGDLQSTHGFSENITFYRG